MFQIHPSMSSVFKVVNKIVPNLFYDIEVICNSGNPRIIISVPEPFINQVEESFQNSLIAVRCDDGKNRAPKIEVTENGMS